MWRRLLGFPPSVFFYALAQNVWSKGTVIYNWETTEESFRQGNMLNKFPKR